MTQLTNILFHVTLALKGPVIVALLAALAWVLYESGQFLREYIDRKIADRTWRGFLILIPKKRDDAATLRGQFFSLKTHPTLLSMFAEHAREHTDNRQQIDKLISDIEIEANRRCYRMRVGVRVGPILGLMGTLIPMGPALMSISTGNLEAMAHNLIIAFSTTVVGLMIGALCLIMLIARQHWYAKDMSDIEHLYDAVLFPEGR